MRDINHHAEAIHLPDDFMAEGGEAVVVRDGGVCWFSRLKVVSTGVCPVRGVGPGEGHVADA